MSSAFWPGEEVVKSTTRRNREEKDIRSSLVSERPERSAPRTLDLRGRAVTGSVHCEVRPPSMIQLQPVIDVADGPNKKATKSATSSTVMNLFTRKRFNMGWTTI